jgi:hypothetical protein
LEQGIKTHKLKTIPEFFEDVVSGKKTFEARVDDRYFAVGDTLILQEYYPEIPQYEPGHYTGREFSVKVNYLLDLASIDVIDAQGRKFVVMGIEPSIPKVDVRMRAPLSRRGIPLIWSHGGEQQDLPMPVLTAESYMKWYELYLVSDTDVQIVHLHDLEPYAGPVQTTYRDHAPNPAVVEAYCEAHNYSIDPVMLYVADGMWLETKGEPRE